MATTAGLTEDEVRWTPPGRLTSLIGIVNHLVHVEWRWIDGCYLGAEVSRSEDEFVVPHDRSLDDVLGSYGERAQRTDSALRAAPNLDVACHHPELPGLDLRWVLVHLIEETAHHAGHADSTREMLDGTRAR